MDMFQMNFEDFTYELSNFDDLIEESGYNLYEEASKTDDKDIEQCKEYLNDIEKYRYAKTIIVHLWNKYKINK